MLPAEFKSSLIDIHGNDPGSRDLSRQDNRETDWTDAGDESEFLLLQSGPADGMRADGEGLNQYQLVERQLLRLMELSHWNPEQFLHSPVAMNPQHLQL